MNSNSYFTKFEGGQPAELDGPSKATLRCSHPLSPTCFGACEELLILIVDFFADWI